MSVFDDVENLRDDEGWWAPEPEPVAGSRSVVAKTKTISSYPAAAGQFFACETQTLTGTEQEGSPGVLTGRGDTFYAYLPPSAPSVPTSGTVVVCTFVDDRWVMEY